MLTLSAETVRNHVRSLLRALNGHTRLEAVATARRLGLLALPVLRPPNDAACRPRYVSAALDDTLSADALTSLGHGGTA
jgi:hypothetical protein